MEPKLVCVTCDWKRSDESLSSIEAAEEHQREQIGHIIKFESSSDLAAKFR